MCASVFERTECVYGFSGFRLFRSILTILSFFSLVIFFLFYSIPFFVCVCFGFFWSVFLFLFHFIPRTPAHTHILWWWRRWWRARYVYNSFHFIPSYTKCTHSLAIGKRVLCAIIVIYTRHCTVRFSLYFSHPSSSIASK